MKISKPQLFTILFLFLFNFVYTQKGSGNINYDYSLIEKTEKFDKSSDVSFVNYQPILTSSFEVTGGPSLTVVNDNKIYVNSLDGLFIIDMTDINSPVILATSEDTGTQSSIVNQSINVGGYAHVSTSVGYFVVNDSQVNSENENYGSVYSITDYGSIGGNAHYNGTYFLSTGNTIKAINIDLLDAVPFHTLVSEFSAEQFNDQVVYNVMTVEGNFLYASRRNGSASSGLMTNYLDIFNISDPSNPNLVNSFSFSANWDTENLLIHNNIVYLSAGGPVISRVDISNPSAPLLLDPIYHEETEGSDFYGVGVKDNILYASSYFSSRIFSYDITNSNNPQYIGYIDQGTEASQALFPIKDSYMLSTRWIANGTNLDIFTLVQPLEFVSATIDSSNTTIDALVSQDIELDDVTFTLTLDNLCDNYNSTPPSVSVSNVVEDGGVLTFTINIEGDLCGQETLTLNSEYQTYTDSIDIQIENYTIASTETEGSDSANSSGNLKFEISGDKIIVAKAKSGASVYSVSSLNLIESFDNGGNYKDIIYSNGIIYAAASGKGLISYNPNDFSEFTNYNTNGSSISLASSGNLLYLSDFTAGIRVFNNSEGDYSVNPSSIEISNFADNQNPHSNLTVNNSILGFTNSSKSKLILYDVSDPLNPNLLGSINAELIEDIAIDGNKIYAIHNQILNIYQIINGSIQLHSSIGNDSNGNPMVSPTEILVNSEKIFIGGNGIVYTFNILDESVLPVNTQNISGQVRDIKVHEGNLYLLSETNIDVLPLSFNAPTFDSIDISADNSIITLDFSENVYANASGSGDLDESDFSLTLTDPDNGSSMESYSVMKISDSSYQFNLVLAGEISGNESITINPVNQDGTFSVYSGLGVPMALSQNNNSVNLNGPAYIVSTSISEGNLVTVNFSEDVYTSMNSEGDLVPEDFSLVLSDSQLASVDSTPTSITKNSQSEWVLSLNIVGTIVGGETLTVNLVENSIFNSSSVALLVNQTDNSVSLLSNISSSDSASAPNDSTSIIFVEIYGDFLYATGMGSAMYIYDKNNLSAPVGNYQYPQDENNSGWTTQSVTVVGNYAYVPSFRQPNQEFETDYGGMTILDITDKTNPQIVSHTNIGNGFTSKIHVVGSRAYVSAFASGIYIYDVSSPNSPTLLGSFGNPTGDITEDYTPPYNFKDVYVDGDYAYLACFVKGFVTLDISDPNNINETGTNFMQSYWNATGREVNIYGDFIQLATFNGMLFTFNKSENPSNPTFSAFYTHPDAVVDNEGNSTGPRFRDILQQGNYIYTSFQNMSGDDTIKVFDVNTPESYWFSEVANITNNPIGDIAIDGNKIYAASWENGINVYDLDFIPSAITDVSISDDNLKLTVSFNKDSFSADNGVGDLTIDNFNLQIETSNTNVSLEGVTPSSVNKISNQKYELNIDNITGPVGSNDRISVITNGVFNSLGLATTSSSHFDVNNFVNFNDVFVTIDQTIISSENTFVNITFSDDVYGGNNLEDLTVDGFSLSLSESQTFGTAELSSNTPLSVEKITQSEWRLEIPLFGIASDDQILTINVDENSIFNAQGYTVTPDQQNNSVNLNETEDAIQAKISAVSISEDNNVLTVSFSKDVFSNSDGTGDLNYSNFDFNLEALSPSVVLNSENTISVTKISNSEYELTLNNVSGPVTSQDRISVSITGVYNAVGLLSDMPPFFGENNWVYFNDIIISVNSISISNDNSYVDILFSEPVYGSTDLQDLSVDDFELTLSESQSVGNAQLTSNSPLSVVSLTQSEWRLFLPLDGFAASDQTLTVDILENSIFNINGHLASSSQQNNFINLNDTELSNTDYIISQVAVDNRFVEITSSASMYSDNQLSELSVDDFVLSLNGGSATLGSDMPTSIVNDSQSNTYRLFISISGQPDGNETLTVNPRHVGSIVDSSGSPLSTDIMLIPVRLFPYTIEANTLDINQQVNANRVTAGQVVISPNSIGTIDDSDLITFTDQGEVAVQGEISINSDVRLKTNIVSLGSTLINLLTLDGKRYKMINDDYDDYQIGLLAQDVQKVFPELVMEDSNGILSVNYQALIPVLVNALKEMDENYRELENELSELEKLID